LYNNCLHNFYVVLVLQVIWRWFKVYRRVCVGYMGMQYHFICVMWASLDFGIHRGSWILKPVPLTYWGTIYLFSSCPTVWQILAWWFLKSFEMVNTYTKYTFNPLDIEIKRVSAKLGENRKINMTYDSTRDNHHLLVIQIKFLS
jgi:hypothetical protein